MSFFAIKTALAVLLLAVGLTAAISMLTLMGKPEKRMSIPALMRIHRTAGYVFVGLLLVLAVMGVRYLAAAGDSLALRGVLHWTLAAALILILALKLAIVRTFKQFVKFAPVLGMTVITMALLVATISAGFFAITRRGAPAEVAGRPAVEVVQPTAEPAQYAGNPEHGKAVFAKNCSNCHNADSTESVIGPGLAGLFERAELPSSGRPVTRENVLAQIVTPMANMPSFQSYISDDDLIDLLAYIETL
jgi:mono/diheme cytochrome c family protein